MELSIALVNRDGEGFLEKCLRSIYKNSKGLGFETFVVDNASSDQSLSCLRKFPNVDVIRNKKNLGFAKANNQAIRRSKGRYILLLNPDTLVLKNSFKNMIKFLDKNKDIGVLGCKLLNPDGSVQPSCHAFLTLPHVFFEISQLDRLFPKNRFLITFFKPFTKLKLFVNYSTPDKPVEVDSVMGSCYMIRKNALDKTGLLDGNFFLYHEEMELSYRMWQKGYKVVFYPHASVVHYGKHSTRRVPDLVFYERCRSILYFFKKHKPDQFNILKKIMFLSLLINSLSLIFRKDFKNALNYRLKVFKLLK